MSWRAWHLADRYGFPEALHLLLDRALAASAGRTREDEARREALREGIIARLGEDPLMALRVLVLAEPRPSVAARTRLVGALRALPVTAKGATGGGLGEGRARAVAWNAALPLLTALAAAYGDTDLARWTATLAEDWPAPAPYGRTRRLASVVSGEVSEEGRRSAREPQRGGALFAQGLLHLQDLWCERGGCGVCPLSEGHQPG